MNPTGSMLEYKIFINELKFVLWNVFIFKYQHDIILYYFLCNHHHHYHSKLAYPRLVLVFSTHARVSLL